MKFRKWLRKVFCWHRRDVLLDTHKEFPWTNQQGDTSWGEAELFRCEKCGGEYWWSVTCPDWRDVWTGDQSSLGPCGAIGRRARLRF